MTHSEQVRATAEEADSLDILVNNAGLAFYDDLAVRAALEQHLAVNLFGTYGMIQAFVPKLARTRARSSAR